MGRTQYVIQRIFQAIFTVIVVVSLSFFLIRLIPGGPAHYMMARLEQEMMATQGGMTTEEFNRLVEQYVGIIPDDPIYVQYFDYLSDILTGDFGHSFYYDRGVNSIMAEAIPWTVFLFSTSLLISFFMGVILGALMAYYEGSRFDVSLTSITIIAHSIPFYVVAILLLFFLGFIYDVLPVSGRYDHSIEPGFNLEFMRSVGYHALMPQLSMIIAGFGGPAVTMRANAISVLGSNYIRAAKIRGLAPRRLAIRYVGRNAVLPLYTSLMISFGTMFGGSVILEEIFLYRGVGYYMFQSISARDYPLMMGAFILITVMVVIGVLLADLTYGYIDPRAGDPSTRESF